MTRSIMLAVVAFFVFASQAHAITFAQLALGGGYEATLIVTNKTSFAWAGSLRVRRGMNERWIGSWTVNGQSYTGTDGANLTIGPKGTFKIVLRGDATTRTGYLELNSTGSSSTLDIAVAYFYNFYSSGILTNTTGSPESKWDKKFIFTVERSAGVDTGFAWSPRITTSAFQVKLTLIDANGNQVASKTVDFTGQKAEFISQTFPTMPANFLGHVLVESQSYICLEVLRMETTPTGFLFTSTPADDYVP